MPIRDATPDYAIGPLLQRAHRHAADAFNSALTALDIQGRHFGVLMTLQRLGPMNQTRLVEHLGADKSAMVRMIDDLESRGFVKRCDDPADRRAVAVTLTESGTKAFKQAETIAKAAADDLLEGFDAAERAQFKRLLGKFVNVAPSDVAPLPGRGQQ
ncbi:MarR family transcriptional regulator [Nocardia sp. NPDC004168]|uniref:MarR family winged helix-turn-helix transcriptional regulator n=1 Tax=Nocardia TaxID=1817 RepID=UPI0033A46D4A